MTDSATFRAAAVMVAVLAPLPAQSLTHGTMVGSVGPTSAIVWAAADQPCTLRVLVGADGQEPARNGAEAALTEDGGLMGKVALRDLRPDTEYRFCVELVAAGGAPRRSPFSTFRTAPPDDARRRVAIAFGADVLKTAQFAQWTRMAAHAPAFYVSLGDMPYADGARTRAEYRKAALLLREDERFQQFFAHVPIAPVWDDHEVENDWDGATDATKVRNGTAAWRDCMPVPDGEIWRAFRWGRGVEVFLLDCRSHRAANAAPDLPGKSMLGEAQRQWLVDALAASTATWKLVATSSPLVGGTNGKDSWVGFQRERDAILAALSARRVHDVVFLTADQHWAAVHDLPGGFCEVQVGPVATFLREPPSVPGPEVRYVHRGLNYGLLEIDPGAEPPTLQVSIHGEAGEVFRTTLAAGAAADLQVDGAVAGVRWSGEGPLRLQGRSARDTGLRAGEGELRFAAGTRGRPAPLPLVVPPGSDVHVAVEPVDDEPLLRLDGTCWPDLPVADEGDRGGPSAWFASAGRLWQSSLVRGPADAPPRGTSACLYRDAGNAAVAVRVLADGDGAFGLWLRRTGPEEGLRFCWDRARARRQLERHRGGNIEVLAGDAVVWQPHREYAIRLQAVGEAVALWIDGAPVFAANAPGLPARGAAALWTAGNLLTGFGDVVVAAAAAAAPVGAAGFGDALAGWRDAGADGGNVAWRLVDGVLRPAAAATGARTAEPHVLLAPGEEPRASCVHVRLRPDDAKAAPFGLIARWTAPDQLYRLLWDPAQRELRLERQMGTFVEVLGRHAAPPADDGLWHDLALTVDGFRLQAWCDDEAVVQVLDGAHDRGAAGVVATPGSAVGFTAFAVDAAGPALASAATVAASGEARFVARVPSAPGGVYALELQLDRPGPLRLERDGFAAFALQRPPAPLVLVGDGRLGVGVLGDVGPRGEISAALRWPPLRALRGQVALVRACVASADGDLLLARTPPVRVVF